MGSFELKLISKVHANPCIWNPNLYDYRNNTLRNLAWDKISRSLHVPVQSCRTRWRSLRDRFRIEILRKKTDLNLQAATWPYVHKMMFLKNAVKSRAEKTLSSRKLLEELGGEVLGESNNFGEKQSDEEMGEDNKYSAHSDDHESLDFLLKVKGEDDKASDDGGDELHNNENPMGMDDLSVDNFKVEIRPATQSHSKASRLSTQPPPHAHVSAKSLNHSRISSTIVLKKDDAFLNYIGDIFLKVPEHSRLDFKMDVLNYAHKQYAALKGGADLSAAEEPVFILETNDHHHLEK